MDFHRVMKDLACVVGETAIMIDPDTLAGHGVDGVRPGAVVFPTDIREISEIVKYANEHGLALVPRGSGTKMAMGNPPKRLDLVVSTCRLNRMKDVDTANLTLTVEAGVIFRDVQARLATEEGRCYLPVTDPDTPENAPFCSDREHKGSFLPIDAPFAEQATIGGIIATNSSGPRRLLYTNPRDIILGVRFVSPTGDIVGMGGKTVKNVSGYDVSKLMVGSMGTLGILCDVTLRLLPLPERMETLLVGFSSFEDAAPFADRLLETRLLPAAVEVMTHSTMDHILPKDAPALDSGRYFVALAFEAFDEAVDRMNREAAEAAAANHAAGTATLEKELHGGFWLKFGNLGIATAEKFPGFFMLHLNYPVSIWKEIFRFAEKMLRVEGIDHTVSAHAGIGICKITLSIDGLDPDAVDRVVRVVERLQTLCRGAGGNCAVHNAPAEIKARLKVWGEEGPDLLLMRRIKEKLDPLAVMSPGRFVGGL